MYNVKVPTRYIALQFSNHVDLNNIKVKKKRNAAFLTLPYESIS